MTVATGVLKGNKAFVEGLGIVEKFVLPVATGNDSAEIILEGRNDANYVVITNADYTANTTYSSKTVGGFTLGFADPLSNKVIQILVV